MPTRRELLAAASGAAFTTPLHAAAAPLGSLR